MCFRDKQRAQKQKELERQLAAQEATRAAGAAVAMRSEAAKMSLRRLQSSVRVVSKKLQPGGSSSKLLSTTPVEAETATASAAAAAAAASFHAKLQLKQQQAKEKEKEKHGKAAPKRPVMQPLKLLAADAGTPASTHPGIAALASPVGSIMGAHFSSSAAQMFPPQGTPRSGTMGTPRSGGLSGVPEVTATLQIRLGAMEALIAQLNAHLTNVASPGVESTSAAPFSSPAPGEGGGSGGGGGDSARQPIALSGSFKNRTPRLSASSKPPLPASTTTPSSTRAHGRGASFTDEEVAAALGHGSQLVPAGAAVSLPVFGAGFDDDVPAPPSGQLVVVPMEQLSVRQRQRAQYAGKLLAAMGVGGGNGVQLSVASALPPSQWPSNPYRYERECIHACWQWCGVDVHLRS